ncbi:hypothetical protein ACJIZ3_009297 [Penstemon smallii]|uniref:TPX2 central domain-containing protein n=1 Tax=Penstemon smallii TaxID=265156 RepID=A0ABD3TC47_9LAMI
MDEEMEGFIENVDVEPEEIDENYEFNASQFYDFTRLEFDFEIEEAERWFEVCGDYDPSPFVVLMNSEKLLSVEIVPSDTKAKSGNNAKSIRGKCDTNSRRGVLMPKKNSKGESCHMLQDTAKAKAKSANMLSKTRSSTLMKPTASHLAKQNKLLDIHSKSVVTRTQKTSTNPDKKSLQSSSGLDNLATKRQKLEIGYLRKIAHLKHHILFLHKSSKKVTIPREPELETLARAQRRSSKNSSGSSENKKEKGCGFKARPLNRKIMESPSLPRHKKKTPQSTEFQVFHLKTMDRANQHASAKVYADPCVSDDATKSKRPNSRETLKPMKQEALLNSKACFLREEDKLSTGDKLMRILPILQFAELSLGSDIGAKRHSTRELKENTSDSLQSEFRRCHAKPKLNQCGGHLRVHEARCWPNMTRSLDIR